MKTINDYETEIQIISLAVAIDGSIDSSELDIINIYIENLDEEVQLKNGIVEKIVETIKYYTTFFKNNHLSKQVVYNSLIENTTRIQKLKNYKKEEISKIVLEIIQSDHKTTEEEKLLLDAIEKTKAV